MEDEHRLCCRRTGNIDAPLVSRKRCEAASETTGQPRFHTCKSGVFSDAGSTPTKSVRHLRPREGAKCAPTPLHHPTAKNKALVKPI